MDPFVKRFEELVLEKKREEEACQSLVEEIRDLKQDLHDKRTAYINLKEKVIELTSELVKLRNNEKTYQDVAQRLDTEVQNYKFALAEANRMIDALKCKKQS